MDRNATVGSGDIVNPCQVVFDSFGHFASPGWRHDRRHRRRLIIHYPLSITPLPFKHGIPPEFLNGKARKPKTHWAGQWHTKRADWKRSSKVASGEVPKSSDRVVRCSLHYHSLMYKFWPKTVDATASCRYYGVGGEQMSDAKKTMTLNLNEIEMRVLEVLAKKKDLTKTGVIRQAIRLYQLIETRLEAGEKLVFEDEKAQKKSELMVL
ncbi:MAG: CopG family transcriptional regulator [Planctomycetaceae bacterium]